MAPGRLRPTGRSVLTLGDLSGLVRLVSCFDLSDAASLTARTCAFLRVCSWTFCRCTSSTEVFFSSSILRVIAPIMSSVTTLMWLLTSWPIDLRMEMRASLESFFSLAT